MIFQPSVCSSHSHVLCVSYSFLKGENQYKNQFKLRHVFISFYLTNFPPTALLPSNFPRVAWTLPPLSSHRTNSPSSVQMFYLTPPHSTNRTSTHPTGLGSKHLMQSHFTSPIPLITIHPIPPRAVSSQGVRKRSHICDELRHDGVHVDHLFPNHFMSSVEMHVWDQWLSFDVVFLRRYKPFLCSKRSTNRKTAN